MKTTRARRYAALFACAGLGLATPAFAQDKTVKIGVLNDMSSLYADIGGANSVAAVKMAVEDSGLPAKCWKIEVLSGDHQQVILPDLAAGCSMSDMAEPDQLEQCWSDLEQMADDGSRGFQRSGIVPATGKLQRIVGSIAAYTVVVHPPPESPIM